MVVYEWCAEVMCPNGEDIGDLLFGPTVKDVLLTAKHETDPYRLVLVRDRFNNVDGGLEDRQWAYVQSNGSLPATFDGGALVPNKFRKELARA